MRLYYCTVFGKEVEQPAINWTDCQAQLKQKYPSAKFIKYLRSIDLNPKPKKTYQMPEEQDNGDFDDAGKIGKDSYEWRNRHAGSKPSLDWGYTRQRRRGWR